MDASPEVLEGAGPSCLPSLPRLMRTLYVQKKVKRRCAVASDGDVQVLSVCAGQENPATKPAAADDGRFRR